MKTPIILFLLFACSASLIICLSDRSPMHYAAEGQEGSEKAFNLYLSDFVSSRLPGPHAYRILVPANIVSIANVLRIRPLQVDFAAKVIILTLFQVVFFLFLRQFTTTKETLLGVVLILFYIGAVVSYPPGPSVVETIDFFNLLIFASALFALSKNRFGAFCVILFVGMINRETPILLSFVPLLMPGTHRARRFLAAFASVAVPYGIIHALVTTPDASWWKTAGFVQNIPLLSSEYLISSLAANIKLLAVIGVPIALASIKLSTSPKFLEAVFWLILPFIAIHYVVGRISELRLWLPLLVMIMPLVLGGLDELMEKYGMKI